MTEQDRKQIENDVKEIGKEILDRKLTKEEIKENTNALVDYFEIILDEDTDGNEDAAWALFDDDFYNKLKEYLEQND